MRMVAAMDTHGSDSASNPAFRIPTGNEGKEGRWTGGKNIEAKTHQSSRL